MNDLTNAIIGCLPLVLLVVLMAFGASWLGRNLLPNHPLLRRSVRAIVHLIFIAPLRNSYRAVRWLCVTAFNANPNYRTHQLFFDNYPVAPLELYGVIEAAFEARQINGVELSRVSRLEWHLLSSRRVYLHVRFRDAVCFIGAIPMGNGLLVSWRYSIWPGRIWMVLFQIPLLGILAERTFLHPTFHRTDVYFAFEQAIQRCVAEATDTLAHRGVRPLADNEQQPLLREFYG